MKLKKLFSLAVTLCIFFNSTSIVNASAEITEPIEQNAISTIGDITSEINSVEEEITLINGSTPYGELDANMLIHNSSTITSSSSSGDSYENNNGPTLATTGRFNTITKATIHSATDSDWFKFEIVDTSKPYSFILTNIPIGCDYDMYLVSYDDLTETLTMQYYDLQDGNTSEAFYLNFSTTGVYYIVVQPDTNYSDTNYSDSEYKLYIGNYYKAGSYGYTDTNLSIDFGYVPIGNTTKIYRGYYAYDLSNNSSIPDGALVNSFYLTADGNGAYWIDLNKMLYATGQGYEYSQYGGIPLVYSDSLYNETLYVKQTWGIGGYLIASTYFVWTPRVLISYTYPVVLSNLHHLG